MASNVYLVIDPPGNARVNVDTARGRSRLTSALPHERGHARVSLDGTKAIIHGTFEAADLGWLLSHGWATQYDHAGILAYLATNRAAWEPTTP